MTGKILRFDESRGYGFIAPDEGHEDVFMHANDLLAEEYLYQAGRRVEFFIEEGGKGPKASEIRLVTPTAASDPVPPARRYAAETPPPSAAPTAPTAPTAAPQDGEDDEPTCDVLSPAAFHGKVTEILINADGSLTAAQILKVRTRLADMALAHGWVEVTRT